LNIILPLVPPVISAADTTEHATVREASNVTLRCAASGHPMPSITWSREDNLYITPRGDERALQYNGTELALERVGRAGTVRGKTMVIFNIMIVFRYGNVFVHGIQWSSASCQPTDFREN
jgi:hypothetical protein